MRVKATFWFSLLATTCLAPLRPGLAGELPAGGSVAYGSVGIATPGANTMTIRQSSAAAIVNWQSFSVGAGASVNIQQPSASSALLNRVTGSATSTIAGQVNANGQVYLVNPNGIVITPTGTVRAGGGFVASTLGMSDEDFKAGRRSFSGNGSSAAVVNQGTIEVGRGGYAALIGGSVENAGTISVPMGRVGLGAGERATLDLSGDGFLQVAVPSGSAGEKALIQHSGRIRADGGRVEMQAATAREVARQAINLTGVVEARSVGGRSGAIVLGGGAGGSVAVSGRLDASATRQARRADGARTRTAASGKGGAITVTGDRIRLTGATLDASGRTGGGTIKVGGDLQGGGALPHARSTTVDAATRIVADATETGDGGRVILWSDEFTGFGGLIRARGGAQGGDGGFAEVSSKGVLGYDGTTVLTAANGKFGTLLLDPYDIVISTGASTNIGLGGTPPDQTYTPSDTPSVLNVTDLQNALATANIRVQTSNGSSCCEPGNITVAAPITWSQPTTLTLDADNNIIIQQAITATAGGLTIQALGTITATAPISVATFTLTGGTWSQTTGPLPAFSATDFRLTGGRFLRATGGDGTSGTPYLIADVYGLQGINSTANLPLNFQLANDIDATGTSLWNAGAGFVPIGGSTSSIPSFSGTFNGDGRTIDGLFINRPGLSNTGLFGSMFGSVTDLTLTNASIAGAFNVGAIAGESFGTIARVRASGTVSAAIGPGPFPSVPIISHIGGLVGTNEGTLSQSYSTVTVNGGGNASAIGGLVGTNYGTVFQTYASGSVTSGGNSSDVGGLVGANRSADSDGSIAQSYATGAVSAGTNSSGVGGLAGSSTGPISQSYAVGAVTAGAGSDSVGGFLGTNDGSVASSFWDTTTSGQAQGIGTDNSTGGSVLTGLTTTQFQDPGIFVPQARTQGWSFETSWAPPSPGFYPELYVIAPVIRAVNDGVTRPYGGTNSFPLLASYGGPTTFVFGPAGDAVDLSNPFSSPATATSPVGTYAINGVNQTSTQGLAYRVVATQTDAALVPSLTVTPAPLTITANDQSKTYGATFTFLGTEFGSTGLQNGETIGSAALSSTGQPGTAGVGPYAILVGAATGGTFDPTNYTITYVQGTMTVTPAPLTLTANDQTKTYGTTFSFLGTEFGAAGLQNGETVGSVALSSTGAPATAGVGPYAIPIGGAAGGTFDPENYAITYVPGAMTVTPAPLTVTANDQTKTYGSPFAFLGTEFSTAGLQNSDAIDSAALSSTGTPATANAGPHPILIGGATGTAFNPANYTITYMPGTMTVTPAPLTVTANDQTKTYGSPFAFLGTEFGSTGLQNGETIGSAALSSAGASGTAGVGSYAIAVGAATGGTFDPANYAITYVPGAMSVTPAPLTITANDQTRTYGSPFAFLGTEFSAAGLQNGETIGSAALSSTGAPATANVGLYPILIGAAAGGSFNPANYTVTYVPGAMSVTPAPLFIAANDQTKALGLAFSFTGQEFTATGLQNGETVGSAALSSEGAAAAASFGLYSILVGVATGGTFDPANYAVTYVPGTMTVGADPSLAGFPPPGNPVLDLPTTTVALPNPPDSFDLGGGGNGGGGVGGGPTFGVGRPGEIDSARSTLASVERSSNDLESKVAACENRFERQKSVGAYKTCVGDALEQFADALDARGVDLPGPMRGIPAVIRQAARQVRAARTIQEARTAVGAAVAEVRKAIALIRADDPAIGRLQIQQANRIASALGSVENRLSRATGL